MAKPLHVGFGAEHELVVLPVEADVATACKVGIGRLAEMGGNNALSLCAIDRIQSAKIERTIGI